MTLSSRAKFSRSEPKGVVRTWWLVACAILQACNPQSETGNLRPTANDLRPMQEAIERVKAISLCSQDMPWTIMHAIMAFGPDFKVVARETSNTIKALDYLLDDRPPMKKVAVFGETQRLLSEKRYGGEHIGVDHDAQLLAFLLQVGVPLEQPLLTREGRAHKLGDLIPATKLYSTIPGEYDFRIYVLASCVPAGEKWLNIYNKEVDFHACLRYALGSEQESRSACWRTHLLYSLAQIQTLPQGKICAEDGGLIDSYVKNMVARAVRNQNRDGSFNENWYEKRAPASDSLSQLAINGHMLAWLMLPREKSASHRAMVHKLAKEVARTMLEEANKDGLSSYLSGAMGHPHHTYAALAHAVQGLRAYLSEFDTKPPEPGRGEADSKPLAAAR